MDIGASAVFAINTFVNLSFYSIMNNGGPFKTMITMKISNAYAI